MKTRNFLLCGLALLAWTPAAEAQLIQINGRRVCQPVAPILQPSQPIILDRGVGGAGGMDAADVFKFLLIKDAQTDQRELIRRLIEERDRNPHADHIALLRALIEERRAAPGYVSPVPLPAATPGAGVVHIYLLLQDRGLVSPPVTVAEPKASQPIIVQTPGPAITPQPRIELGPERIQIVPQQTIPVQPGSVVNPSMGPPAGYQQYTKAKPVTKPATDWRPARPKLGIVLYR